MTTKDASGARTILITGCSSGIGDATAKLLRRRGWRVFASCRKGEDCNKLIEQGFDSPLIDYQKTETIHSGFHEVMASTGGRLDALYNNGAFATPGAVEDLPTDALREIFEANFFGWHELTRLALPVMRRQRRGRLVQCSSVLGFVTLRYRGAYQATKFALEGYTDTLRLELAGSGVAAILIEPGPINTKIRVNSYPRFKKWITWEGSAHEKIYPIIEKRLTAESVRDRFELPPEAVAKKIVHAIESPRPKARYFVTTPTYFMGWCKRLLSTRWLDRVLLKR